MSSGILRSWYLSRLTKAHTPVEYMLVLQEYMLYEMNVLAFETKAYFKKVF